MEMHPLSGFAASPSLFGRWTTPSLRGSSCSVSLRWATPVSYAVDSARHFGEL